MDLRFYFSLFGIFFRIGMFTFGGGFAMLPLIEREVVRNRNWLSAEEFIDMLAMAQSVPGPIAVNTSVFVGYKLRGVRGALVAALGVIVPSFVVMLLIVLFFVAIRHNPEIERIFKGIRPAVAAMIAAAVLTMGRKARLSRNKVILAIVVTLLIWLTPLSPVHVILLLFVYGFLFYNKTKRADDE